MALRIGDQLWFAGAPGRIVALTDSTDETGRGWLEYAGQPYRFRVLQANHPPVPFLATADPYFRVGLLQRENDPSLFCLVAEDLPAPLGWGRWIQPERWQTAWELAAQDSVVFVLGWRPGPLIVKQGGLPLEGAYVDLVLQYATETQTHTAWWLPAYPYGEGHGRFRTTAEGEVKLAAPNGSLSDLIFPRGMGALGHRAQDRWPSAPTPERTLQQVRLYYRQEWVEVAEGQAATLDVAAGSLTLSGPPNAKYEIGWEDGWQRRTGYLDGAGQRTINGLLPGTYWCALYHPSDKTKGLPRQAATIAASGSAAAVDFGSTWGSHTPGYISGLVYAYGVRPCAGARVWIKTAAYPTYWECKATTGQDGAFAVAPGFGILIEHDDYGCMYLEATRGGQDAQYLDPALGGRLAVHVGWSSWINQEGVVPWGAAGPHLNLPVGEQMAYLKRQDTGAVYWLKPTGARGCLSEPLPRLKFTWGAEGDPVCEPILYDLYSAEGELLQADWGVGASAEPPWCPPRPQNEEMTTTGGTVLAVVGGKIHGDVVEADRSQRISPTRLAEAARLGVEFGDWQQPLEARALAASVPHSAPALTFQAWECPFCGGPVWPNPDRPPYRRGYCMACADRGLTTDARTYFITPTLSPAQDWCLRWVKNTPAGGFVDREVSGWPRPEEYAETDPYLAPGGPETSAPEARWFATHLLLGTLQGGVFTKGESVADAESRLGRPVGPIMLKVELLADYRGTGKLLRLCATPAVPGFPNRLTITIPPGAEAGEVFPLHWAPHWHYPRGYYLEVTDMAELSGDGYLACRVVNDGPAWPSSIGVAVLHHRSQPYACDVSLSAHDPFLVEEGSGRLHFVYLREGQLLHRTLDHTEHLWSPPVNISVTAAWPHPCREPSLALLPHGELVVAAHTRGHTRLWRSRNEGEEWE